MTTNEEVDMMDNDPEMDDDEICDSDDKLMNCAPFPDECDDEVDGIERLYACFEERYNACPAFYTGSLSAACESSFKSTVIDEHRPILVYLHDDKSMLNNIFCKTIFCSEIIIDYLIENYIVWPWDITSESNKYRLIQIWEETFFDKLFDIISTNECPILIGIMRRSAKEKGWTSKSVYQFKLLLKGDTLAHTHEKSSRETVLRELSFFKDECDDNEQILSFDFSAKTGLCLEIVLEIAKYLSLNDAISAFSDNILPSLYKYNTKVQICEPSKGFVNMILRKIDLQQIVSLHVNAVRLWSDLDLPSLVIFTNVISLTLVNPSDINQINKYTELFPKLNCLSLCYDTEINFNTLSDILCQSFRPIRRFEIHCAGSPCRYYQCQPNQFYTQNLNVRYFLFDVRNCPLPSMTECFRQDKLCFLLSTINFIKSMHNIRYVHLVANKHHVDKVLDWNQWKTLLDICPQLKKITIEMFQSIISGEQLIQKALEINKVLQTS